MMLTKLKAIYEAASRWLLPAVIVVLFFSIKSCQKYDGTVQNLTRNLDSVARTAKTFQNQAGLQVAENQALRVQSAGDLTRYADSVFNLKKANAKAVATVSAYAHIIQEFQIQNKLAAFDTQYQPLPDTVLKLIAADSSTIHVPAPFHYSDSTVSLAGTVLRQGVQIEQITVPNKIDLRILTEKTGFLKLGRSSKVQVVNSNPNVHSLGVTAIVVPPTVNWWNRVGKPVLVGILVAGAVGYLKK